MVKKISCVFYASQCSYYHFCANQSSVAVTVLSLDVVWTETASPSLSVHSETRTDRYYACGESGEWSRSSGGRLPPVDKQPTSRKDVLFRR